MAHFCSPRRLTSRLVTLPILLLICLVLCSSLYSLLTVSTNVKISQQKVTEGSIESLSGNRGPKIRLPISPESIKPRTEVQRESGWTQNATGLIREPNVANDVTRSGGNQRKILILAYYRSGSTLTGSFFDHLPGVFYTFEPLYAVYKSAHHQRRMKYLNGNIRQAPRKEELSDLSLEILQTFYSCNLEALDWHTLISGFGSKSTAYAEYVGCLKSAPLDSNNTENVHRNCLPGLIQKCKSSNTIVLKTIRVMMTLAEKLLKVIPDLKIVHLMRDPRGMACSLQRKQCQASLNRVNDLCTRLTTDVLRRRALAQIHPKRVYSVKYEDVIQSPLQAVMNMFRFLGLAFHSDVSRWIFYCLFSGRQDNGQLSVTKSNSMATAYNWTRRIHWSVLDRYQHTCADFLRQEHYPIFQDIYDVRNFRFPNRNLTEQLMEIKKFWSAKDRDQLTV